MVSGESNIVSLDRPVVSSGESNTVSLDKASERLTVTEETPYLPVLQFHVQEVEIPEDSELLLAVGVIHVLLLPGAVLGGHQARLMLRQIQVSTRGKNHLGIKRSLF